MLALLITTIIANAFIVLRFSPSNFYKLHRYDGQLLYIKATFIGVLFTAISYLLNALTGTVEFVCKLLPEKKIIAFPEYEHLDHFFIFFLFAVFISFAWCLIERGMRW